MKSRDATLENSYYIHDSPCLEEAAERIKRILDAKYEPANLEEIVANHDHLSDEEKEGLYSLLKKYESLFDGSLGTWKGEDYNIELRSDATPYHARTFPIPRIHEQTLRHEVNRLYKIGVLKKVNRSE
jgi:hypothetical protein